MNSDFTLLASPMAMGFVSALLKKMQDKLVPIIHPYIKLVRGESRHRRRYDRYPVLGLLLEVEADTDREDLELTVSMQSQFALDMRSRLAVARLVTQPVEELVSEIDGAQRLAAG